MRRGVATDKKRARSSSSFLEVSARLSKIVTSKCSRRLSDGSRLHSTPPSAPHSAQHPALSRTHASQASYLNKSTTCPRLDMNPGACSTPRPNMLQTSPISRLGKKEGTGTQPQANGPAAGSRAPRFDPIGSLHQPPRRLRSASSKHEHPPRKFSSRERLPPSADQAYLHTITATRLPCRPAAHWKHFDPNHRPLADAHPLRTASGYAWTPSRRPGRRTYPTSYQPRVIANQA